MWHCILKLYYTKINNYIKLHWNELFISAFPTGEEYGQTPRQIKNKTVKEQTNFFVGEQPTGNFTLGMAMSEVKCILNNNELIVFK